jgi:hypothetical protein
MASLRAPREGWAGNEEANREKINGIVTALLALIGLSVEPVKDKEHVLIANIFEYAWARGQDLTLEDIIIQVQRPPFEKLGVFPVDDYMSEKERRKLAMDMNNIIAAPSFQSWIQGEPLDIQNLLYMPNGQARVSIFYIAHLSEAERQFMILLLENVLGWMRGLSGTTSLRALMYIDEMFGYFPPYPKNPPTKEPILRLLKQARAFGLGMILATQNPGDLDYKGLSNAGTWFIGRLQSENDRVKVMSGLESLATADTSLNLKDVGRLIADIEPRVFLMNNVHDTGGPVLVHTRWAMSYLRGPLTRQQVQILMSRQRQELFARLQAAPARPSSLPGGFVPPPTLPEIGGVSAQTAPMPPPTLPGDTAGFTQRTTPVSQVTGSSQRSAPQGFTGVQPPLPSSVAQYFLTPGLSAQQAITTWGQRMSYATVTTNGATLTYRPVLLAQAAVRYQDRKANLYTARVFSYQIPELERTGLIHWEQFVTQPVDTRALTVEPASDAIYGELTAGFTDGKRLTAMKGELVDMLYNTGHLVIPFNPTLGLYANPDAAESEFMAQAQQLAHENRDAELDKLAAQYEKLMDKLEDQIKRKERELSAEKKELADRKREELFTKGEAVLSLLKGRTTYTLSRTSRTARMRRQTKEDLTESEQVIADLEDEIVALEQRFEAEIKGVNEKWAKAAAEIQEYRVTAYKKDIQVELFGVGWIPYYYAQINGQPLLLAAF